jgi:hypothetical protein
MKNHKAGLSIIYIMIFFLSGCNNTGKYYYLKDQWQTSSMKYSQVNNKPEEVKEYLYPGENNISQSDLKNLGSYDLFKYDQDGNLLSRKLFFNDDMWYQFEYTFSVKGYEVELTTKSARGLTKRKTTLFEVKSDGSCEERDYEDSLMNKVKTYHYKNDGNEIICEYNIKSERYKTHSWYKGQRILKQIYQVTNQQVSFSSEHQYYYDKDNYLDSIIAQTGKLTDRRIFMKNKYGDPVSEIWIKNADTLVHKTYSYLYDNNNNWVRRLEQDHQSTEFSLNKKSYSLIVREIKY